MQQGLHTQPAGAVNRRPAARGSAHKGKTFRRFQRQTRAARRGRGMLFDRTAMRRCCVRVGGRACGWRACSWGDGGRPAAWQQGSETQARRWRVEGGSWVDPCRTVSAVGRGRPGRARPVALPHAANLLSWYLAAGAGRRALCTWCSTARLTTTGTAFFAWTTQLDAGLCVVGACVCSPREGLQEGRLKKEGRLAEVRGACCAAAGASHSIAIAGSSKCPAGLSWRAKPMEAFKQLANAACSMPR